VATAKEIGGLAVLSLLVMIPIVLPFWAPASSTEITAVRWEPDLHAVQVFLDSWPGGWDGWKVLVNGQSIPMEGGTGRPVIRPNAPLRQPPTGLIIGTLPWVTGLDEVDFPCCGTIQLCIPGHGLTNAFQFNLTDLGCKTASDVNCPSEWTIHEGDLVIRGGETRVIENEKFFQKGNVYVQDKGTLIIRDTEFMMARGDVPTVHVYFFVDPGGKLIIEKSRVYPPAGGTEAGLVCVMNRGEVQLTDSQTMIHYFDMSEGAKFTMVNSEMVNPIGGLLQITGGNTRVVNSTIGALGLFVPAGARLTVDGLHSGVYLESWSVRDLIRGVNYDLMLEKTTILKDDLSGELKHGPYERGWIFFLDPNCHARISNSELRKVFIEIQGGSAEFRDLKVGLPTSLAYRDIVLRDVVVMGQWPFTVDNAQLTITNSNYLFLQPSGFSTVRLVNSHVVELIPRDFFGSLICDAARWTTAGEIIGGMPYHSGANRFTIKGSLQTDRSLRQSLQWKGAEVTREYEVVVTNMAGQPVKGATVKVGDMTYNTDHEGKARFSLVFNETNYNIDTTLESLWEGRPIIQRDIDFFTETPITIRVELEEGP